jgi:uncharacterized small protein (TIGR04563 family)
MQTLSRLRARQTNRASSSPPDLERTSTSKYPTKGLRTWTASHSRSRSTLIRSSRGPPMAQRRQAPSRLTRGSPAVRPNHREDPDMPTLRSSLNDCPRTSGLRREARPHRAVTVPDAKSEKRKQSFYFPAEMLEEIAAEARRLDRSMSWIVQRAWKLARRAIAESKTRDDRATSARTASPSRGRSTLLR